MPFASGGVLLERERELETLRDGLDHAGAGGSLDQKQRALAGACVVKPVTQRLQLAFALEQNAPRSERHYLTLPRWPATRPGKTWGETLGNPPL